MAVMTRSQTRLQFSGSPTIESFAGRDNAFGVFILAYRDPVGSAKSHRWGQPISYAVSSLDRFPSLRRLVSAAMASRSKGPRGESNIQRPWEVFVAMSRGDDRVGGEDTRNGMQPVLTDEDIEEEIVSLMMNTDPVWSGEVVGTFVFVET